MNIYTKIAILIFSTIISVGCVTPPPTYSYQAQVDDPTIEFTSEFKLHTFFSVNIINPKDNLCQDFDTAGFILHTNSILIYDKPSTEAKIQAPANKPILVRALYSYSDGRYSTSCGPITSIFTPESGKFYLAQMLDIDRHCRLIIVEKDNPNAFVVQQNIEKCK